MLLTPCDELNYVWETEETRALEYEKRSLMLEKTGTVKPVDYDALNKSSINFVSQKEFSPEQIFW